MNTIQARPESAAAVSLASPFPDRHTRVVTVGATGAYGQAQIAGMRSAGTRIVANVAIGRAGRATDGIPAFDSVAEAVAATGAEAAAIYTPAPGIRDAVTECAEAGIRFAVAAAEFVPLHDTLYACALARRKGLWLVGPNTLGMTIPGETTLGSIPREFTKPGAVAVFGRSGTLTATAARLLSRAGIGQRALIHIGGDALCGRNPHEYIAAAAADARTAAIVYLGEIGGTKEFAALEAIRTANKPVVALIVGRHAPPGRRMGHAGALVEGERATAQAKRIVLRDAGAHIVDDILELPGVVGGLT
jgi:succinyl-CoA synthetase alpha subunit